MLCLCWPDQDFTLELPRIDNTSSNAKVELLGYKGDIRHRTTDRRLTVYPPQLPSGQQPCRHACVSRLTGFEITASQDVAFAQSGSVTLKADQAVLEGDGLRVERKSDRPNVGFWDNPEERVHWLVRIAKPGSYVSRGEFAAAAGPSRLTLETGGKLTMFDVPETAAWESPCRSV